MVKAVGKPLAISDAKLGPVSIAEVHPIVFFIISVGPMFVFKSIPLQQATAIPGFPLNACRYSESFWRGIAKRRISSSVMEEDSPIILIDCGMITPGSFVVFRVLDRVLGSRVISVIFF